MTPTEMRDKAEDCDVLTQRLQSGNSRHFMHQAANQWREMARQMESLQADELRIRRGI